MLWITPGRKIQAYDEALGMLRQRLQSRSWTRRPSSLTIVGATIALCCVALTCSAKRPPSAATPVASTAVAFPPGPPPPSRGLGFLSLAVPWTPPTLTAGDPGALADALSRHRGLTVALGPQLSGPAWQQRSVTLVAALSPNTTVQGQRVASIRDVVADNNALARPKPTPGPQARPHYPAPALASTAVAELDDVVFLLDEAPLELDAWNALPAVSIGSCAPAMTALAQGQELALAQLEPFLDHADALLLRAYRAELAAFVPGLVDELAGYSEPRRSEEFANSDEWATYACGHAYHQVVKRHASCLTGACPVAPRLVLVGGAHVVVADDAREISDQCPALVGRDHILALRRVGQAAAEAAGAAMATDWTVLADRFGLVSEVHAVLEDVCTPRRRRLAAADVTEARSRLARIGVALASDDRQAAGISWQIGDAPLAVPGMAPMRSLAQVAVASTSTNATILAETRALREFVLSRSRCDSGHNPRPLVALVAGPSVATPFVGYFYEEELFCDNLPPHEL